MSVFENARTYTSSEDWDEEDGDPTGQVVTDKAVDRAELSEEGGATDSGRDEADRVYLAGVRYDELNDPEYLKSMDLLVTATEGAKWSGLLKTVCPFPLW